MKETSRRVAPIEIQTDFMRFREVQKTLTSPQLSYMDPEFIVFPGRLASFITSRDSGWVERSYYSALTSKGPDFSVTESIDFGSNPEEGIVLNFEILQARETFRAYPRQRVGMQGYFTGANNKVGSVHLCFDFEEEQSLTISTRMKRNDYIVDYIINGHMNDLLIQKLEHRPDEIVLAKDDRGHKIQIVLRNGAYVITRFDEQGAVDEVRLPLRLSERDVLKLIRQLDERLFVDPYNAPPGADDSWRRIDAMKAVGVDWGFHNGESNTFRTSENEISVQL